MSRRLRSIIPTTEAQLQPRVLDPNKVKEKLRLKQEKQKYYFNQHTRQLPALEKGKQIRVRMGNRWEPRVVVDHAEKPRSYKVQTDNGGEYRRNRKMLMKLQAVVLHRQMTDIFMNLHQEAWMETYLAANNTVKETQLWRNLSQRPKSKREIIQAMALWRRQNNRRLGVEEPYGGHYDLRTMFNICGHWTSVLFSRRPLWFKDNV